VLPAPVPRPGLAHGAGVGGPVHELVPPHQADESDGGAPLALLALTAIRIEGPVKIAGGTVHIDVKLDEDRPARGQVVPHHLADCLDDAKGFSPTELVSGARVMQARPPQRLVRIDIPDA
jgi:hypothetical protein